MKNSLLFVILIYVLIFSITLDRGKSVIAEYFPILILCDLLHLLQIRF